MLHCIFYFKVPNTIYYILLTFFKNSINISDLTWIKHNSQIGTLDNNKWSFIKKYIQKDNKMYIAYLELHYPKNVTFIRNVLDLLYY